MPAGLALQRHGRGRHVQPCPELGRLDRGSLGQLAAGDPGRKAEIVLDPSGGAGLTAGGDCVDSLNVEALRGRVEGSGEPTGPRTHDHDVAQRGRRAGGAEADRSSELGVARISQDLPSSGDRHRGLVRLDGEAVEKRIRVLVVLEIDPLVGHSVPRQELAQAAGVG